MTSVLDLPTEVLLQIFEFGCDKEYQDGLLQNPHPTPFPWSSSAARQRKDFAKPVFEVCKRWMALVDLAPELWVTRIGIGSYLTSTPEDLIELIKQSSGSDLDIHFSMKQIPPGRAILENLFEQYLLPLSPRWRCLESQSEEPEEMGFIWDALRNGLPRLVMVRLSLVPKYLEIMRNRFPRLMLAFMEHYSLPDNMAPFPFAGLMSIHLSQPTDIHIDRQSTLAALRLSSTTLTHLSVTLNYITKATQASPAEGKLVLPSLQELRVESYHLEAVLDIIQLCSLPNLERLYAHAHSDNPASYSRESVLLPQVKFLSCKIYNFLYEQFFEVVELPLLCTLALSPLDDFESPAQEHHETPLFIFPQLELCDVIWDPHQGGYKPLAAFISQFDLKATRLLRIQFGRRSGILTVKFTTRFPNMSQVYDRRDTCLFFLVPSLPVDLSSEERSRVISAAGAAWQHAKLESALRVQDLKIRLWDFFPLHLSVVLRPFANIDSLSLEFRYLLQPVTFGNVFGTFLDEHLTRGEVIPKLETLRVSLPEDNEDLLAAGSVHLRRFVTEREQAGYPIRKLQVTGLSTESDRAWFRLHVREFKEFVPYHDYDSGSDWWG